VTQEFHISVTPVGQNGYLVRTEQVAPGVPLAEELVTWPVADWLTAAGRLMNDPLNSVLQGDAFDSLGNGNAIAFNSINLVALGQKLYDAIFQGTLRDSWMTAQGIAQNRQQVLRLRLGLKDTTLARLPWEVMHAGDRPLATGPYIAFSRYQSGIGAASRLPSSNMPTPPDEGGIKVLMVIASPTDQVRLDLLKQEAIKLQAELHRHSSYGVENVNLIPEIELTLLEQPGREELTQALEQGRHHVLHYSGHSNRGSNGGEIYLVSGRTGLTETLSGDDLAGLLVNNNIQMAVFNSCLGAYTANVNENPDTGERNLTESLVKRGIRSVLAMSERIPDEVALTLTQLFYRNLSQGYPVDLCVSRVRQGLISAYSSHQMYWALPILYLQPEFEGYLSPGIYLPEGAELLGESDPGLTSGTEMFSGVSDDSEMPLPIDDMISASRDSFELDNWLGEDSWGDLVDEIEYDDPSYVEDSALVSDLFSQFTSNQKATTEQSSMSAGVQQIAENSIPKKQATSEVPGFDRAAQLWEDWENSNLSSQASQVAVSNYPTAPNEPANFSVSPSVPSRKRNTGKRWSVIGIVGASAVVATIGLTTWWHQNQNSSPSDIPRIAALTQPSLNNSNIDLETAETKIVTEFATRKLSSGDLPSGLAAVEELLNPKRNALKSAQVALNIIPPEQIDDPAVNFLKGRLAWQSVQTGDTKFSIDDARRYWESAAKAKPDSLLYVNALGFAYYAENNLDRANDAWFRAIDIAIKRYNLPGYSKTSTTTNPKTPPDALTPYAGLAMGMYKSAHNLPPAKKDQYLREAIKLRQMVMKEDPNNFQTSQLSQNWLWNEKAIEDWRSLVQLKGAEK
jgi:tetratricopeptide (TPR) repeat protein